MSLLGIGSARVDLVLEREDVRLGDSIRGHFSINGGTVEQQIKRIECDLLKIDVTNETEEVVDSTTILSESCIESDVCKNIPFSFYISPSLVPTGQGISYRFKTRLVFQEGVMSLDQDLIKLLPQVD
ncbi:sporulation protein [Bacillus sp. BGMRC 2118]|nr:sporulation protein [Bacillus sp. BGMRC 2118]